MNLFRSQLFLFWQIGKAVYEKQTEYENVIKKYSDYCSYYYGNSFLYTRENIHFMKKFYLNYPIFTKKLDLISWEQYKLLLSIDDKFERDFYFRLSLLFHSNYAETLEFMHNKYYLRI